MRKRTLPNNQDKVEVTINNDGLSYSCLLTDISASGISVRVGHFIPTYKEIEVVMEIAGEKVTMKGSVRWSIDPGTAGSEKGKLGILIMDPPPAYLEFVRIREEKSAK
ncbi:MAG: PilZ domain-containing protein [Candidatus Aminicenantes bacterium]|nr:PilZ domain-containing protein [Candidatus Aminicenantes bacterium]